jgi:hypothetical protein
VVERKKIEAELSLSDDEVKQYYDKNEDIKMGRMKLKLN